MERGCLGITKWSELSVLDGGVFLMEGIDISSLCLLVWMSLSTKCLEASSSVDMSPDDRLSCEGGG